MVISASSLEATSPLHDWRYTAEGGANLVLSYIGSDSSFTGKLLRLRKRKVRSTEADASIPDDVQVEFGERIIAPVLGAEYVVQMHKYRVDHKWLEELKRVLEQNGSRPRSREDEDEIDNRNGVVVLAEDLVHGKGVLAIEIKPKWGFLPRPDHLSPATRDTKTSFCRFCMHRYHKAVDREAIIQAHEHGYCPLDLYSGVPARVSRAVEALVQSSIDSKGSANNLRIFLEGHRLYLHSPEDQARLCTFLDPARPPATSIVPLLQSMIVPYILNTDLLARLKRAQSVLDRLDIEGLASLLERTDHIRLSSPNVDLSHLGGQPTMSEWLAWVGYWDTASAARAHSRPAVLAYLLSATFKDCSIFLRITRSADTGEFDVTMKAIDLDPKPIDRLGKYYRRDQEIALGWQEMLESLADPSKVGRCKE